MCRGTVTRSTPMVPLGQQGTTLDAQLSRLCTQAALEPHHSMQSPARCASAGMEAYALGLTCMLLLPYVMASILCFQQPGLCTLECQRLLGSVSCTSTGHTRLSCTAGR